MDIKKQLSVAGEGAKLVAKQAEKMKVANVNLPGAYRKLGEEIFKAGALQDKLGDVFTKIRSSIEEQEKLNQAGPAAEGFGQKMKAAAISAKNITFSKNIAFKRGGMFGELGRLAFKCHKEEIKDFVFVEAVEKELEKLAVLDNEILALSSKNQNSFFNSKTVSIGLIAITSMAVAFFGYKIIFGQQPNNNDLESSIAMSVSKDGQMTFSTKGDLPLSLDKIPATDSIVRYEGEKTSTGESDSQKAPAAKSRQNRELVEGKKRMTKADKGERDRKKETKNNEAKTKFEAKNHDKKGKNMTGNKGSSLSPPQVDSLGLKSAIDSIRESGRKMSDQMTESAIRESALRVENDKRRMSEEKKVRQSIEKERKRQEIRSAEMKAEAAKAKRRQEDDKRKMDDLEKESELKTKQFADIIFNRITFDASKRFIVSNSLKKLGFSISFAGADFNAIQKLHSDKDWIGLLNFYNDEKIKKLGSKNDIVGGLRDLDNNAKTVAVVNSKVEFFGLENSGNKKESNPILEYIFFPIGMDDKLFFLDTSEDKFELLNNLSFDINPSKEDKMDALNELFRNNVINSFVIDHPLDFLRDSSSSGGRLPDNSGWYFKDKLFGRYIFISEENKFEDIGTRHKGGPILRKYLKSLDDRFEEKREKLKVKLDLGEIDLDSAIKTMQEEYVQAFHDTVKWAKDH